YTRSLLAALPDPLDDTRPPLAQIPGRPPPASERIEGCPFRPRCVEAREICFTRPPLEIRGPGKVACWVPPSEWKPVARAGAGPLPPARPVAEPDTSPPTESSAA